MGGKASTRQMDSTGFCNRTLHDPRPFLIWKSSSQIIGPIQLYHNILSWFGTFRVCKTHAHFMLVVRKIRKGLKQHNAGHIVTVHVAYTEWMCYFRICLLILPIIYGPMTTNHEVYSTQSPQPRNPCHRCRKGFAPPPLPLLLMGGIPPPHFSSTLYKL